MIKTSKKQIITIKYKNLLIGNTTTEFTFSLSNVNNKEKLKEHLKSISNKEFILNHSLKLQIPNKVFKLNLSTSEIILEKWFYDKIKNTLFINEEESKCLNLKTIPFYKIVKLYLIK